MKVTSTTKRKTAATTRIDVRSLCGGGQAVSSGGYGAERNARILGERSASTFQRTFRRDRNLIASRHAARKRSQVASSVSRRVSVVVWVISTSMRLMSTLCWMRYHPPLAQKIYLLLGLTRSEYIHLLTGRRSPLLGPSTRPLRALERIPSLQPRPMRRSLRRSPSIGATPTSHPRRSIPPDMCYIALSHTCPLARSGAGSGLLITCERFCVLAFAEVCRGR
jgi:hypothetical protein